MPPTNYSNGITSYGVPVFGSGYAVPTTTGKYYFVHSGTGGAGNSGTDPTQALSTVDAAIGKCTADKADVIIVMPGHAETVTATSIALDVAGVSVVGLGTGLLRPTFTYGAAAATITVSADDCTWQNCYFIGNFDNVAAAFTLGAAKDFRLIGNEFTDNSSALHFLSIVVTGTGDNATDGLSVLGNKWWGLALAPDAFISVLGDCDRLTINDNVVEMASTDDEGHFLTLTGDTGRRIEISRNVLTVTGSAGAAVGVFLTASSTDNTGIVRDNYVFSLDTTGALIATAGTGLRFIENYYTGAADASGAVWPAADTPS